MPWYALRIARRAVRGALLATLLCCALVAMASTSVGDAPVDARAYTMAKHAEMTAILRQPASSDRDALLARTIDALLDYDEITRRSCGQPCPADTPDCINRWQELDATQRAKLRELFGAIVQRSFRRYLVKMLDYRVSFGAQEEIRGDLVVHSEAVSRLDAREAPTRVDFAMRLDGGAFRLVDLVTSGSRMSRSYYLEVNRVLRAEGYDGLVQRLREKLART